MLSVSQRDSVWRLEHFWVFFSCFLNRPDIETFGWRSM